MDCPRCARKLDQAKVGLSRTHTCAACGGAWVPFESCEAVMPRLAELAPEAAPAAAFEAGAKLKCPGCGGDLVTVRAQEAGGIAVRTCLVCFGRWVDGAELARTRGRGILGMLRAALRRLAPRDKAPHNAPTPGAVDPAVRTGGSEESARTETPRQE